MIWISKQGIIVVDQESAFPPFLVFDLVVSTMISHSRFPVRIIFVSIESVISLIYV